MLLLVRINNFPQDVTSSHSVQAGFMRSGTMSADQIGTASFNPKTYSKSPLTLLSPFHCTHESRKAKKSPVRRIFSRFYEESVRSLLKRHKRQVLGGRYIENCVAPKHIGISNKSADV